MLQLGFKHFKSFNGITINLVKVYNMFNVLHYWTIIIQKYINSTHH